MLGSGRASAKDSYGNAVAGLLAVGALVALCCCSLLLFAGLSAQTGRTERVAAWVLPEACARGAQAWASQPGYSQMRLHVQALIASSNPGGGGSAQGCGKTAWGTYTACWGSGFRVRGCRVHNGLGVWGQGRGHPRAGSQNLEKGGCHFALPVCAQKRADF